MVGVIPGQTKPLLACQKVVLPVMYLQFLVTAAMYAAMHIAQQYFFSPRFPFRVK
jgi:hypothetical protein